MAAQRSIDVRIKDNQNHTCDLVQRQYHAARDSAELLSDFVHAIRHI